MHRKRLALVVVMATALNMISWYGGVRSPDGEVVFELCKALHDRGQVSVQGESRWPGFGLAPGTDGNAYSVFGPGPSIACVPALAAARAASGLGLYPARWAPTPSPSFYVGDGLEDFVLDRAPDDLPANAERTVASLVTPIVGALAAGVFFLVASGLARHPAAALGVTALFVAGSPMWPYSGTDFSEPLTTLLLLAAYLALRAPGRGLAAVGGVASGAAVASHVTALLALPFLLPWKGDRRRWAEVAAGLGVVLALLAAYNHARFGHPLETGRTADPELARMFGYGTFAAPWPGLYGLLASPGKGLVFYAPVVGLALWCWPSFHRRMPFESGLLLSMCVARVLFVAARSDWHGGFALGPRLLVPMVPFLLLPIVPWLDERIAARDRRALGAFAAVSIACIAQQAMFVIGEPFTFYQGIRLAAGAERVDVFAGDRIYLDAQFSPALHLLERDYLRGSWLLRRVPIGHMPLWMVLSASLAGAWLAAARSALRLPSTRPEGGAT